MNLLKRLILPVAMSSFLFFSPISISAEKQSKEQYPNFYMYTGVGASIETSVSMLEKYGFIWKMKVGTGIDLSKDFRLEGVGRFSDKQASSLIKLNGFEGIAYYRLPLNENNKLYVGLGLTLLNIIDRKSTRLNSSHIPLSRMPSSAWKKK